MLLKMAATLFLSNWLVLVTTSWTLAGSAKGCCFNRTSAAVPLFAATSKITSAYTYTEQLNLLPLKTISHTLDRKSLIGKTNSDETCLINSSHVFLRCLSISFLESTWLSVNSGVPWRKNSKKELLLPRENIFERFLSSSYAAFLVREKSRPISVMENSTLNAPISSRKMRRCLIKNNSPSSRV